MAEELESKSFEEKLEELKEVDPLKYDFWNYLKIEDVAGDYGGGYQRLFRTHLFDNASEELMKKTLENKTKNLADCFGYVLEVMRNKYIEKFGRKSGGFAPDPRDVFMEVMHYFEEDSIAPGSKPAEVKESYKCGGVKADGTHGTITVDPAKDIEKIKKEAIAEYKAELKAIEEKKKAEAKAKKEAELKAKEEAKKKEAESTSLGGMFDLL